MLWQHRMALPERSPAMPPTIMESRVKGIQERALHTLVMRLTFRNIFFHGAVIFRGPLPKQGAQLENTCFKRATQNPPGTCNASKVRKPNETWIIWGSATEPQIIKFHFNLCKNRRVDSPRLWQKKQNFHYPVKKVCSGISVTNIH